MPYGWSIEILCNSITEVIIEHIILLNVESFKILEQNAKFYFCK